MQKTVRQVLVEARELVARPNGWTKGAYERRLGATFTAHCAVGAVCAAAPRSSGVEHLALEDQALDALGEVTALARGGQPFALWNDRPERTQQQVVAAFDAAIALYPEE